jgi:ATP-binding cassette, subfamily B (MDR/TAP), member 1
VATDENTED